MSLVLVPVLSWLNIAKLTTFSVLKVTEHSSLTSHIAAICLCLLYCSLETDILDDLMVALKVV